MDKFEQSVNWNVRDELKGKTLEEINQQQPKYPFAVGVINVDGDLNIGMMLRTAVIFGASNFFIFGKKKFDKRSTVGAQNYIELVKADIDNLEQELNNRYYFPVFIETGYETWDQNTAQWLYLKESHRHHGTPCFVFGNEAEGISKELIGSNTAVSIYQPGVLRSLNVSAAAAIVMQRYSEYLNQY